MCYAGLRSLLRWFWHWNRPGCGFVVVYFAVLILGEFRPVGLGRGEMDTDLKYLS